VSCDSISFLLFVGVLESFEDHPPLNMPLHSALDLHMPLEDKTFHQCLDWINSTFGGHQSEGKIFLLSHPDQHQGFAKINLLSFLNQHFQGCVVIGDFLPVLAYP